MGSYGNSMFNFWRNHQTVHISQLNMKLLISFYRLFSTTAALFLYSHQQDISILISPPSYQHLLFCIIYLSTYLPTYLSTHLSLRDSKFIANRADTKITGLSNELVQPHFLQITCSKVTFLGKSSLTTLSKRAPYPIVTLQPLSCFISPIILIIP